MKFSFGTIATPDGERAALVASDGVYRLDRLFPDLPATGLRGLLDAWDQLMARVDALGSHVDGAVWVGARVDHPEMLAPVRFPNKLICVGAVYRDHLEQMHLPAERWPRMPIFLRPPTTSIVGPGRTVRIPATTREFDWEIELVAVIGRRLADADEAAAAEAIAGYSVGIDFSCRDLLDPGAAAGVDLGRAKAQDTMAPMGPVLRPARDIGDPQHLALKLWVNDELRQDGTTADMLFPVYEQIATISRFITLEPGDVVFTGSPAGSARSPDQFLKAGDRIRAEIERVGVLELELSDATPGVAQEDFAIA